MRVLQYLWFHFITVATGWLPDLRPVLRLRGFLLRPSFRSCGGNLQVARDVAINFTNHLEIGSDVFIATGCWLHAWGELSWRTKCNSGRTPFWSPGTTRQSMGPTGSARAILRRFAFAKDRGSRPMQRSQRVS